MLSAVACGGRCGRSSATPAEWSPEWVASERQQYLNDPAFRRRALVASLANPDNTYSQQRLDSYGRQTRGWDLLPEWNPRSAPMTAQAAAALQAGGRPSLESSVAPLWNTVAPTTDAEWIALGRQVFFGYPLRAEAMLQYAVERPDFAAEVGLERDEALGYPGLRIFADVDGTTRVGMTCALCHSAMRDGALVVGEARRNFDYGKLKLAYHQATSDPLSADLARRMPTWGPGRADVTEDKDEDPVAIPDLFGLQAQSTLTQAGTIVHATPVALAIRQETQLLHSSHERVRPPRELAWALAMYLYSLQPPGQGTGAAASSEAREGAVVFVRECGSCHSNAALGGPPVSARSVGTDPALAFGEARGTGRYRPPALIRVRNAAPYLHHGALATLEDLLSAKRLEPGFRGGTLGPGPVPGHAYGLELDSGERAALLAYLRAL